MDRDFRNRLASNTSSKETVDGARAIVTPPFPPLVDVSKPAWTRREMSWRTLDGLTFTHFAMVREECCFSL